MIQVKKCDCKNNWTWKNSCFGLPNSKSRWYKLPPFIVFEGTRWETVALDKEIKKCCIVSSPNAWMNTELTHTWVNKVLDTFSFRHCYLVWDSMNVILKILQSFPSCKKERCFDRSRRVHKIYIRKWVGINPLKLLQRKNTTSG